MKQRIGVIVGALCLFLGTGLLVLDGCGTTPATKITQADQLVITSVNAGVPQIVSAINAGKLTKAQTRTFLDSYTAYYNAQMVLKAVIEKLNAATPTATADDATRANAAVVAAEQSLLSVINTLISSIK